MTTANSQPQSLFLTQLQQFNFSQEGFAVPLVESLLKSARLAGASDIHLQPTGPSDSFEVYWRQTGVLQHIATVPKGKQHVIARLKVLADLLTYKTDAPQEGRIRLGEHGIEMRLSTFPTIHGEKGVVRLFIASDDRQSIDLLGLPDDLLTRIRQILSATNGVFLATGPAGSGKTTTLYACLRHLINSSGYTRSLSSLEDPVEAIIPQVAQSQIRSSAGFTYASALKSLLRQDPEVIMVGEIRDHETAEMVFQASLTGHFVLTSFHSGNAAEAISRLSDMGLEPYVLRSGLKAILAQRLVRAACPCSRSGHSFPQECPDCNGTGYHGRLLLAELALPDQGPLRHAILSRSDSREINAALIESGMISLEQRARQAVAEGRTTPAEIFRVLGVQLPADL